MIVELKTYTTYVGKTAEFVRLYEEKGLPIQQPVQGDLLGMYQTEFGPVNQVILLWRYADEADRRARRTALMEVPEWRAFLGEAAPLVQSEDNRLLVPTPASP